VIIHNFKQNSPDWHAHRAAHFNASDAPAMMGVSPYKSRTKLIHEIATGIIEEVDASTQERLDDGHRCEALARPLAEKIIGEDLYPVVGSDGKYSASYDGLTMEEIISFEHKRLNAELRQIMTPECDGTELPIYHRIQMEHQCMVCNTIERTLFMASQWDINGQLIEERHRWYLPDLELRAQIIAGWAQFDKDVAAYVPVEVIPAVKAKATIDFPAPAIEVGGAIALKSNLPVFGQMLKQFIASLPEKPSTDQEFADCKAAVAKLKEAEETLDAEESRALSQLTEIDAMRREKKLYSDLARETRLALDRLVKSREEMIKAEIVMKGKSDFAAHIAELNKQLGKAYMPDVPANFAEVIKNKRTITSLQGAVNDELARVKIVANEIAGKIQINLNSLRELATDHAFLFADTPQIVMKANDDLVTLIKMRIAEHKQAEEKRLEAERDRIRAEEEAKAKAAAEEATRKAAAELAANEAVKAAAATISDQPMTAIDPEKNAPARQPLGEVSIAPVIVGVDMASGPDKTAIIDTGATMKLGQISELLGFSVTANFLHTLGIESVDKERAAVLYRASDFPRICACLIANINAACVDFIEGQRKAA
jgi:putative phage-type endonuclease